MSGLSLDDTNDLSLDGTNELDLNGSGAGGNPNTWESTEATDTMSFHGSVPAVAPIIDATFGTLVLTGARTTSFSGVNETQKTAGGNEVVVCVLSYDLSSGSGFVGQAPTVSGLTFTRAFEYQNTNGNSHAATIEVWTAPASSQFNSAGSGLTWSFSFSSTVDNVVAMIFAVEGCNSITSPFDSNGSFPADVDNSTNTTPPTATFSTSEQNSLVVAITAQSTSDTLGPTTPGGWTNIGSGAKSTGIDQIAVAADGKAASGYLTNSTYTNANSNGEDWTTMVLAFASNPPPPPSGTWESTEGKDTMLVEGGLVGGAWHSTDTKDTFDFTNRTPIGSWASNEAKDLCAISGFEEPPLALDGSASAGINGPVTTGAVTLTTTQANDVIVLGVVTGGFFHTATVASIADTAGLTWKKRNQRFRAGSAPSIEIWWAHAPTALTGDVITVTFEAETGAAALIAFGVSGANYTTPWDTHTQAGGYADQVGNVAFFPGQSQMYTNASRAFVFGLHGDFTADGGLTESPFTYLTGVQGSETDGFTPFASVVYETVDTAQLATNVIVGFPYAGGFQFAAQSMMFDAIVGAGETGTASAVNWYWDASYANGILALTSTTDLVLNYSSLNNNLMLLVEVMIQSVSGDGEVTSIDESQNLLESGYHFQRRSRVVEGTLATEIWWAWMNGGAANNDTITINTSGTTTGDVIAAQMWGLGGTTGSFGLGDPFWDGNPSVPATNQTAADSPPPNVTDISTDTPSCLLVAWTANNTEAEPGFVDPFVTLTQDYPNTVLPIMQFDSNGPQAHMGFEFMYVPGLAADDMAEFLVSPEPVGWMMIGDAIPVGPPQPPTGVWASTDKQDKFTNDGAFDEIWTSAGWIGYVPAHATWASTEHPDENTNAGRWTALGWDTGWIGFLPLFLTWHSTENKDTAALYAWLLGFGKITGQMNTTEHKDYLSFSKVGPAVTGKFQATESKDRLSANAFPIPKAKPSVPTPKKRVLILT